MLDSKAIFGVFDLFLLKVAAGYPSLPAATFGGKSGTCDSQVQGQVPLSAHTCKKRPQGSSFICTPHQRDNLAGRNRRRRLLAGVDGGRGPYRCSSGSFEGGSGGAQSTGGAPCSAACGTAGSSTVAQRSSTLSEAATQATHSPSTQATSCGQSSRTAVCRPTRRQRCGPRCSRRRQGCGRRATAEASCGRRATAKTSCGPHATAEASSCGSHATTEAGAYTNRRPTKGCGARARG